MTQTAPGEPAPGPTAGADRLAALERRLGALEGRRDGWLLMTVLLSGLALVAAIVAVGLGARAVDESKGNVAARRAAADTPAAGAPARPCGETAGFGPGALVQERGTRAAEGPTVRVEAGDSFFSPTCTSDASGVVMLTVRNAGGALHNVSVPDQGIDQDVGPGQTITVSVKVGASPVQFVCKYHRTSGMVGALLPAG